MNLTVEMKMLPDKEQADSLHKTFEACNAACNHSAEYAFREKCFSAFKMDYALYGDVRAPFPSPGSQFVVRAFKKVEESYRLDKKARHMCKKCLVRLNRSRSGIILAKASYKGLKQANSP